MLAFLCGLCQSGDGLPMPLFFIKDIDPRKPIAG
jgi:hypothetical protein